MMHYEQYRAMANADIRVPRLEEKVARLERRLAAEDSPSRKAKLQNALSETRKCLDYNRRMAAGEIKVDLPKPGDVVVSR